MKKAESVVTTGETIVVMTVAVVAVETEEAVADSVVVAAEGTKPLQYKRAISNI
jgi:hypothetical protein